MIVNDDGRVMIDLMRKAGFSDEEITRTYTEVVRQVDEVFLAEIMSKLTDAEAADLRAKLDGKNDVLERRKMVQEACGSAVNKLNFEQLGEDAAMRVWADTFEKLDQGRADKLKVAVEEYLNDNQAMAKKTEEVLGRQGAV